MSENAIGLVYRLIVEHVGECELICCRVYQQDDEPEAQPADDAPATPARVRARPHPIRIRP